MILREVLEIVRSELQAINRSGMLWKVLGIYLVGVSLTVLLSWSHTVVAAEADPPRTWNWFAYMTLGSLGYAGLSLAADLYRTAGRVAVYEWVYYDAARVASALIGRFVAVTATVVSAAALALPVGILAAASLGPTARGVVEITLVTGTTCACLIAAGLAISTGTTEPPMRLVAAHGLYAVFAALSFVVAGWLGPAGARGTVGLLSPLGAIRYFLTLPPSDTQPPFPWTTWFVLYFIVFVALIALAYFRLWEWLPTPRGELRSTAEGRNGKRTSRTDSRGEPPFAP